MTKRNDDIKSRLLAVFRGEAQEHLQTISTNLLALERELPPSETHEVVEATFREVHTLKGAARSVSLLDVEALCQALEAVLSKITRGRIDLSRPVLDLLHEGVGIVARLLVEEPGSVNVRELIARLERVVNEATVEAVAPGVGRQGSDARDQPPAPNPQPLTPALPVDTIRVATGRLDALLLQAEDLLVSKLAVGERVQEIRTLVGAVSRCRKTLNQGPGVGGRGSGGQARQTGLDKELQTLEAQGRELLGQLTRDERTIAGTVGGLLEELRRLRLTPASTILDLFPRMVWDLAREHGKEVEWVVQGADVVVDRKVLEPMKEPLIHLIRNAIDHGIELPAVRARGGKPPRGRVLVRTAALEGNQIELCVEDDGAGIDPVRVRAAAVRAHLLSAEAAEALPDEAALELIFRSGVSTSPIITDVSGHGLGLAIVKERVEGLGGEIRLTSRVGSGTSVWMSLPATIATFRGLLVQAGGRPFLLPLEAVERAIRIAPEEVERLEGREAIRWDGQALPLGRLSDILGVASGEQPLAISRQPSASPPPSPPPHWGGKREGAEAEGRRRTSPQPPSPNPHPPRSGTRVSLWRPGRGALHSSWRRSWATGRCWSRNSGRRSSGYET